MSALLDGFNAGVLAFGQTGTGKVSAANCVAVHCVLCYNKFAGPELVQPRTFDCSRQPGVQSSNLTAPSNPNNSQTFTMEGPTVDDDELRGLAPRVLEGIFQGIFEADDEERAGLLKEASSMGLLEGQSNG